MTVQEKFLSYWASKRKNQMVRFAYSYNELREDSEAAYLAAAKEAWEEAMLEMISAICSRCRSGIPVVVDSRGILMHKYDEKDWRDCLAGNILALLEKS